MTDRKITEVAAGILIRPDGTYLLGSRPEGKPYAGYWEFPGGKLEAGETPLDALQREFAEEMGIRVIEAHPWLVQTFDYPHALVRLHFFRIDQWEGDPQPHEGQSFAWQHPGQETVGPILPANGPILKGLRLPQQLVLSHATTMGEAAWLEQLDKALAQGPLWLMLREPEYDDHAYAELARSVAARKARGNLTLLLHNRPALAVQIGADGVHVSSNLLHRLESRPADLTWFGASTHHIEDLQQCVRLGTDYAVLGHVAETATHPGETPLGWTGFTRIVNQGWPFPILGIGGLKAEHGVFARQQGAHGIALQRAFWQELAQS